MPPNCSAIRRATIPALCSPPRSIWKPRRRAWWRTNNALAMSKSIVLAAGIAVAALLAGHAAAQQRDRAMATVAEIPLTGDDGQLVPNHAVKLLGPIDKLPGVVTVGNPNGKTTLVEFYDLNCPYCRVASADIADMVDLDPQLKLVLVPFPVLGI